MGEDIYQFHFPHMVQKDGTYYAYFIDHSGGSHSDVGLATSSDSRNWSKQGPVIQPGAAEAMSGVDVGKRPSSSRTATGTSISTG